MTGCSGEDGFRGWQGEAGLEEARVPSNSAHWARWRCCVVATQCHRGLFRGRLFVAGHLQESLRRTGRHAAKRLPA